MGQSIRSILPVITKLEFVAQEPWARARLWRRISVTTLALLVFAGGLFGALMLTPTGASAAYQAHIKIKGKKQGQFSSVGTKKPSTAPAQVTPSSRGR